ncbi:hypothetical protein COB57_04155 [Candidatus Peregrinibacteria bacterium]|nr:MAG: hypothetical protein COB57_04155 [Candidatus Peregrinibacteria bacterium]
MKIIIFGATGYFGSHFVEAFQQKGWEVVTDRIDITNKADIFEHIQNTQPDVVLNAAGITGVPNVDWCESHPREVIDVNVSGAINIAAVCYELNTYCAYISSGCIYTGSHLFTEEDTPNFYGSLYSRTKLHAEQLLAELDILQLRVRIPIEGKPHRKNVIDKLKNYEKIISIENSFTIIEDFIPAAVQLIEQKNTGIFNMTNEGSMDHKYLMENFRKIVDNSKEFDYMSLEELAQYTKAGRSNCTLNTDKQKKYGIHMPPIQERVLEILEDYKNNLHA